MLTKYQLIWARSVVNGAENFQDMLAANRWSWPELTWLQRRLAEIRKEQRNEPQDSDQ